MLINRERTASHLQELGVEAAILSGGPNFNYAAGWGSDAHLWGGGPFAIVPSDEAGEITLIIANHELPFVWRDPDFKPALRTVGREVEPVPPTSDYKPLPAEERYLAAFEEGRKKNYEDRMEALGDTISDLGLTNAYLGFDDVRVAQQLERTGAFTGSYVDVIQTFRHIRSVKSAHEIEIIRKANEANLRGIEDVVIALREGAPFNEALIQHDIRLAKENAMRSVPSRISGVGRMGWPSSSARTTRATRCSPATSSASTSRGRTSAIGPTWGGRVRSGSRAPRPSSTTRPCLSAARRRWRPCAPARAPRRSAA